MLRYPDLSQEINVALWKISIITNNKKLNNINCNIQNINLRIRRDISRHIPMFLSEDRIGDLVQKIENAKEKSDIQEARMSISALHMQNNVPIELLVPDREDEEIIVYQVMILNLIAEEVLFYL